MRRTGPGTRSERTDWRRKQRQPKQLGFEFRTHGGARQGAGRPRTTTRPRVEHRRRARVLGREPQHVTLRLRREVGFLRSERARRAVYRSLARGCDRFQTRCIYFSVQGDHVHLLVEAKDQRALARAIKGLSVRIARALNKVIGRRGAAFADRYHTRALGSPREVRNALAYVLCNRRHHAAHDGRRLGRWWIDPCSSGWYFAGWRGRDGAAVAGSWVLDRSAPRLAQPCTWLLTVGWRRAGLIEVDHVPGSRT
ncbi:MAG: transposase [Deltaproteobacteria bacterium]|nr:transposase [Deltaproteobacteria bacterium]